ncbi:MAG: RNA polymerase sigma factor [Defluviitaleaceae bacterium]|nr:RNA polymerase sigma factor [Defluviitaleaceae bacterium]
MDDNDILDLFFAREEDALEKTKLKYGQRMLRTAMNILHDLQDAEECVNDTLLKAWQAIPPNRPAMFGAFLAKISRNLAINKWKAKSAARRGGGEMPLMLGELEECIPSTNIGTPESTYEANQTTAAINDCLSAMDQQARVAFVLRYFHGESIASICTRFNMSESKAKSLLFRARKKLKAHLEKEGVCI